MGTLVRTAQLVEDRVESMRREFEPKVRSKWQEARAEWVDFKNKRSGSSNDRLRTVVLRADARLRLETAKFIDKLIIELEKIRHSLPRD